MAGDLVVESAGPTATVLLDDKVVGQTPLTLKDLKEGDVVLGFRENPLGATVLTQPIHVPATGRVQWRVDLSARKVSLQAAAAGNAAPVVAPVAAPATVAPAPKPVYGDLYVSSTPAGAAISFDGKPTKELTPTVLRGLVTGTHHVQVGTECARAEADVVVSQGLIARAELTPLAGEGKLQINGSPAGAQVALDGADVGVTPLLSAPLSCGDHRLSVRAPGFLETTRTLRVPAFETTTVQIDLAKEEFGTLVLDVTPLEVAVRVDGVDLGSGPRTLDKVATGPHHVEGTLDGYAPASRDVTVATGQIARATLTLSKARVRPVKPEKAPKVSKDHSFPIGRMVLDSVVTAAAVGAGYLSFSNYSDASSAYDRYLVSSNTAASKRIYTEEVQPSARRAIGWGSAGVVCAGAAVVLWVKTDF